MFHSDGHKTVRGGDMCHSRRARQNDALYESSFDGRSMNIRNLSISCLWLVQSGNESDEPSTRRFSLKNVLPLFLHFLEDCYCFIHLLLHFRQGFLGLSREKKNNWSHVTQHKLKSVVGTTRTTLNNIILQRGLSQLWRQLLLRIKFCLD